MNKIEFLTLLNEKYHRVGSLKPAVNESDFTTRKAEGFSFYVIGVYDKVGSSIKRGNVFVQIENEGELTENAFWEEKEKPEFLTRIVDKSLDQIANDFILTNKPSGYLKHKLIEGDRNLEYATVDITILESGIASIKKYWIGSVDGVPQLHPLSIA